MAQHGMGFGAINSTGGDYGLNNFGYGNTFVQGPVPLAPLMPALPGGYGADPAYASNSGFGAGSYYPSANQPPVPSYQASGAFGAIGEPVKPVPIGNSQPGYVGKQSALPSQDPSLQGGDNFSGTPEQYNSEDTVYDNQAGYSDFSSQDSVFENNAFSSGANNFSDGLAAAEIGASEVDNREMHCGAGPAISMRGGPPVGVRGGPGRGIRGSPGRGFRGGHVRSSPGRGMGGPPERGFAVSPGRGFGGPPGRGVRRPGRGLRASPGRGVGGASGRGMRGSSGRGVGVDFGRGGRGIPGRGMRGTFGNGVGGPGGRGIATNSGRGFNRENHGRGMPSGTRQLNGANRGRGFDKTGGHFDTGEGNLGRGQFDYRSRGVDRGRGRGQFDGGNRGRGGSGGRGYQGPLAGGRARGHDVARSEGLVGATGKASSHGQVTPRGRGQDSGRGFLRGGMRGRGRQDSTRGKGQVTDMGRGTGNGGNGVQPGVKSKKIFRMPREDEQTFISYKNNLQEYCQKNHKPVPRYTTQKADIGYTATVELDNQMFSCLQSQREKKDAEQSAAFEALKALGYIDVNATYSPYPRTGKKRPSESSDPVSIPKAAKVEATVAPPVRSFKCRLNEQCMKLSATLPTYDTVRTAGGFISTIAFNGQAYQGVTVFGTKKMAEQHVAEIAFNQLGTTTVSSSTNVGQNIDVNVTDANTPSNSNIASVAAIPSLMGKPGTAMPKAKPMKNIVQEYCQKNGMQIPIYNTVKDSGMVIATVTVNGVDYVGTPHILKKTAEQNAAKKVVDQLGLM